jgi:MFS family permease
VCCCCCCGPPPRLRGGHGMEEKSRSGTVQQAAAATQQQPSSSASSVFSQLKPVYLVVFVDTLGLAITIPVLPYYAVSLGVGGMELGLLMTAYSAAEVLGSFLMGWVSDTYGRKPTILVSFAGNALGFFLCAASSSFHALLVARAVGGLGGGSIPVAQAYIADVAPREERSKYIGLTGATIGIAFTLGPGLGALLSISAIGAPPWVIFSIAGGFSLVSLLYAVMVMVEPPKRPDDGNMGDGGCCSLAQLGLLSARFCSNYAFTCMQSTYALLLLARWDYGSSELGTILLCSGFVIAAVQGGWPKIKPPMFDYSAFGGSLVLGCFLYLLACANNFWLHMVCFEAHILGYGVLAVTLPSMVSAYTISCQQGRTASTA